MEVIEVVEVLDHQLDDLRIVTGLIILSRFLCAVLDGFEFNGASFTLLSVVSVPNRRTKMCAAYLP